MFSFVKVKKEETGSSVKYEGFRDDAAKSEDTGRVNFGSTGERTADGSSDELIDTDDSDDNGLLPLMRKSGTFTIDQAVDALGFGKFQIKLSILTGLAWMADAMEMMILSILSPALHCEWWLDSWQQALITTVVFCGMMLSSTMWGNITDKYGRKTRYGVKATTLSGTMLLLECILRDILYMFYSNLDYMKLLSAFCFIFYGLIMCTIVTFYYGLLSSLAPNFLWLLILRGFVGFGIGGVPQSVTLYAEYLPSAHRAKCVVLIEAFWAIGACFETLLALIVMPRWGWRWLLAISSMPMLIFTLCCVWLPESARFQVACGHSELAMATLKRVAEENGTQLPEGKLVQSNPQDMKRGRIVDLFVPELRKTTLILWFIWLANAFSYYGIVLFTTELFQSGDECHGGGKKQSDASCQLECQQLTTNDYMDLLWTTLAEFPGLIITAVIIEWIGRKRTMAVEFLVYSVFVFLLFACLNRPTITVFIFIARAFISGAFQGAYVYTPEVYPTTTRAIGLGSCSAMARIGAIVTPFVAQVAAKRSISIPISIYGTMCILGAVAALLLPIETKGREMKDTH